MATDIFIREGLTQSQMSAIADKYRHEFEVAHTEFVSIVEILEFKLQIIYPDFRLIVRNRSTFHEEAVTRPEHNSIEVRSDIYESACEGDARARFILAHELGHFLLHKRQGRELHSSEQGYDETIRGMNSLESAEDQANIFARCFLIPTKIAFEHRNDARTLAVKTGTTVKEARTAITISKRQEMFHLRN